MAFGHTSTGSSITTTSTGTTAVCARKWDPHRQTATLSARWTGWDSSRRSSHLASKDIAGEIRVRGRLQARQTRMTSTSTSASTTACGTPTPATLRRRAATRARTPQTPDRPLRTEGPGRTKSSAEQWARARLTDSAPHGEGEPPLLSLPLSYSLLPQINSTFLRGGLPNFLLSLSRFGAIVSLPSTPTSKGQGAKCSKFVIPIFCRFYCSIFAAGVCAASFGGSHNPIRGCRFQFSLRAFLVLSV